MAENLVPPYDIGPYDTREQAQLECDQQSALGATCKVVKRTNGKFYCRVTKEPS